MKHARRRLRLEDNRWESLVHALVELIPRIATGEMQSVLAIAAKIYPRYFGKAVLGWCFLPSNVGVNLKQRHATAVYAEHECYQKKRSDTKT